MRAQFGDAGGILVLLIGFGVLLFGLAALRRRAGIGPELIRKMFHIGAGGLTLLLPVLFDSAEPVLALTGLLALVLGALRWVGPLRRGPGAVLHGIDRRSLGEAYFLIAVVVLFSLFGRSGAGFAVPVIILTVADPAAALVGKRWGTYRFRALAGTKSMEGSAAFLITAWLAALPFLIAELGVGRALAVAGILAVSLTLAEAIAGAGIDNLLIPVAGATILWVITQFDPAQLAAAGVTTITGGLAGLLVARSRLLAPIGVART